MRRSRLLLSCLFVFAIASYSWAQIYQPSNEFVAPSLLAGDGNLYGTDADGMFSINPATHAYTVVNATVAHTTLCLEFPDGTLLGLYSGTTFGDDVTVEKITLQGAVTTLATLPYSYTICPIAANDGNYYGGSSSGGSYSKGYLYKMTPAGAVTVIYNFTGTADGQGPESLVQGSDGNLYGIGAGGEMFRSTLAGGITVYSSTAGVSGSILEASDSNFYAVNGENIDRITPTGTVTTLPISLGVTDNQNSIGSLFSGGNGMLYMEENYNYDYDDGCGSTGNWLDVFQLNPLTGATTSVFGIGDNEYGESQSDSYAFNEFLAGNGLFYGGYYDIGYVYEAVESQCFGPNNTYDVYGDSVGNPAINMTVGETRMLPGGSTKLNWDINSAYSDTAQQCYGYSNNAAEGKVPLSGSLTLSYAQPGTYNTAIICGGTQAAAVQVIAGDTQVAIGVYSSSLTEGQSETFAGILSNIGSPAPTGKFEFISEGVVLGSATVTGSQTNFTASTAGIAPGKYQVTAKYLGDSHYAPATSSPVTITIVAPITTTTSLTTSTPSIYQGATASLTATVTAASGSYPTGTVTFYDGSVALGSATLGSPSGYTATATFSAATAGVAPGTYNVTAKYAGGDTDSGSTSSPVAVTVKADGDFVAVTASPNPVPSGQSFTLTATVTGSSSTPTGSVIFYAGSQGLGSTSLDGSGIGTVTISSGTLAAGSYQVTAYYAGDSKNPAVTSPAITLTVE